MAIMKLLAIVAAIAVALLRRRPDSRWSKILLRSYGPRTDTKDMGRAELLGSSWSFLKFTVFSVAVSAACLWGLSGDTSDAEFMTLGFVGGLAAVAAFAALLGSLWLAALGFLAQRVPEPAEDDSSMPINPE
jgi:hypothetical protein